MDFFWIFFKTNFNICLIIIGVFYLPCTLIFAVLFPVILRIYFLFKRPNTKNSISQNDYDYALDLSLSTFLKFHSFLLKKVKVPLTAIYIIINGVFLILVLNNKMDFLDYETFIFSFLKGLFQIS